MPAWEIRLLHFPIGDLSYFLWTQAKETQDRNTVFIKMTLLDELYFLQATYE